jgi:Uma2 family endonuclease
MRPEDAAPRRIGGDLGWEDFLSLPEDGNRYEILDGELVVTPPPELRHQRVSRNLQRILDRHIVENGLGELFSAPVAVRLADKTIVEPDLLFVAAGRENVFSRLSIDAAPDLVVEILSPSTASRDRGVKSQLYARLGVGHYWILDPQERVLRAYEASEDAYECIATCEGATVFRPVLFPDLTIDLGAVWA